MPDEAKSTTGKKEGTPFIKLEPLKDVYKLFCDKKTNLLPLNDVPYVLRATGLTIYGAEEKKIKEEVEKIDGLGKPVSFATLQNWLDENVNNYIRSYEDAHDATRTLCQEEIIGGKDMQIKLPWMRNLVAQVGDKIKPEAFDKIVAGGASGNGIKGDTCTVEDFLAFVQKS